MISGVSITNSKFPSQFVPEGEKHTEKWQRDCVDGAINKVLYTNDYMRKSKTEKIENYNIIQGRFDKSKLIKHLNPMNMEQPDTDVYELFGAEDGYSILMSPLKTLFGEELKRSFDPRAYVVNPEAISEKERVIQEGTNKYLDELLQQDQLDEGMMKEKTEKYLQWKTRDVQTVHEVMANNVIQHYTPKLQFRIRFNECWKDLVTVAEECMYIGDMNGDPYIRKVNPLQMLFYGNGQSFKIHDSTIIIEWGYLSIASILNEFNRRIDEKDLMKLENYLNYGTTSAGSLIKTVQTPPYMNVHNVLLPVDDFENVTPFGYTWYDRQGNILVVRVNWLSQRKVLDLKYYDEYGDEQHKFVPEYYKPNKDEGEEVEPLWINEWWSGVKIGHDIYCAIKPNEVQMRSMTNPAVCYPPYVGIIYNINSGKAFSIVDSIKELAYEYIVYAKKLKHLWLTNMGRVANIDVASIPNGMMPDGSKWDIKRWFEFIRTHRIALRNSFQEDNKGHVVGNMQQNSGYIDMSAATEIDQIIKYLQYLEDMINRLSGVSAQRQGDISPSQGLGTSQQAVAYSATQTEELFSLHEEFKLDVYRRFLEQAKWCLKDKKELRQRILDDQEIAMLEFDGDLFNEAEYDVAIVNSYKLAEFDKLMKTDILSRAVQAGTLTISDIAELQLSNSPSAMIARLKHAEQEASEKAQQMEQQKMQLQQQALQLQQQMAADQHQRDLEKLRMEYDLKMKLEAMKLGDSARSDAFKQYYTDMNNNGVPDEIELQKHAMNLQDKEAQRKHDATMKDKDRQLQKDIADKSDKTKLEIARMKGNSSSS